MNKKHLKEQRAKLEKTKNILMNKPIKTRSAKEQKTIEELSDQIRSIDIQLKSFKAETRKVEVNMDKNIEQRKALEGFIRTKEVRDLNTSNGGAVIPTSISERIVEKLDETAPLFGRVIKLTPVNGNLEILKEKEVGQAGFFGEGSADLDISDFEFEKVKLEQRRAGTVIQLTQKLVNDSGIDIVDYANNILVRRLAKTLDRAMILGKVASEQFEGLCNAPEECEVNPLGLEVGIDDYMNTLNAMHPTLQDKAIWVMSRAEFNKLSLKKDNLGNYYLTRDVID